MESIDDLFGDYNDKKEIHDISKKMDSEFDKINKNVENIRNSENISRDEKTKAICNYNDYLIKQLIENSNKDYIHKQFLNTIKNNIDKKLEEIKTILSIEYSFTEVYVYDILRKMNDYDLIILNKDNIEITEKGKL